MQGALVQSVSSQGARYHVAQAKTSQAAANDPARPQPRPRTAEYIAECLKDSRLLHLLIV